MRTGCSPLHNAELSLHAPATGVLGYVASEELGWQSYIRSWEPAGQVPSCFLEGFGFRLTVFVPNITSTSLSYKRKHGWGSRCWSWLRCCAGTPTGSYGSQWTASAHQEHQGVQYRSVRLLGRCIVWLQPGHVRWHLGHAVLWSSYVLKVNTTTRLTLLINICSETDGYIDNATQKGWLTAILELGAWLGALLSGFIAEAASRKYGILTATAVFILGVVVQITAISGGHNEILAGRFITSVFQQCNVPRLC